MHGSWSRLSGRLCQASQFAAKQAASTVNATQPDAQVHWVWLTRPKVSGVPWQVLAVAAEAQAVARPMNMQKKSFLIRTRSCTFPQEGQLPGAAAAGAGCCRWLSPRCTAGPCFGKGAGLCKLDEKVGCNIQM